MDKNEIKQLKITAYEMRKKVLRMCDAHQAGHLGGAFSCIDMVAALYFHTMNVKPKIKNLCVEYLDKNFSNTSKFKVISSLSA